LVVDDEPIQILNVHVQLLQKRPITTEHQKHKGVLRVGIAPSGVFGINVRSLGPETKAAGVRRHVPTHDPDSVVRQSDCVWAARDVLKTQIRRQVKAAEVGERPIDGPPGLLEPHSPLVGGPGVSI
jgi:hypothetical protein